MTIIIAHLSFLHLLPTKIFAMGLPVYLGTVHASDSRSQPTPFLSLVLASKGHSWTMSQPQKVMSWPPKNLGEMISWKDNGTCQWAHAMMRKSNGIHRILKICFCERYFLSNWKCEGQLYAGLFSLGYLENPLITGNRSDMLERIYATLNMAINAGYIHVSPNPKANGECSQRS